jgi:hypothetical protein
MEFIASSCVLGETASRRQANASIGLVHFMPAAGTTIPSSANWGFLHAEWAGTRLTSTSAGANLAKKLRKKFGFELAYLKGDCPNRIKGMGA